MGLGLGMALGSELRPVLGLKVRCDLIREWRSD